MEDSPASAGNPAEGLTGTAGALDLFFEAEVDFPPSLEVTNCKRWIGGRIIFKDGFAACERVVDDWRSEDGGWACEAPGGIDNGGWKLVTVFEDGWRLTEELDDGGWTLAPVFNGDKFKDGVREFAVGLDNRGWTRLTVEFSDGGWELTVGLNGPGWTLCVVEFEDGG